MSAWDTGVPRRSQELYRERQEQMETAMDESREAAMAGKQIQEIDTEYGSLQFQLWKDNVMLTGYRGKDITLAVPEQVAGRAVTVIGKKAFLGMKNLRELVLPGSIASIEDWAFASCRNLEKITLPRKEIAIGQGILKDCENLQQIIVCAQEDVSYLLAAVMGKLDAFYLFDTLAAGSREWFAKWDTRMMSLMEREDAEGFSKMLLCGEEDYGSKENNLEYYIEQKRRSKVRLSMLRLMHDAFLPEDVRKKLASYLQAHKKGEASEETWKVVLEEHGDDRRYYQFLIDYGCITGENFDAVLTDMGNHHTEMKAFLMNRQALQENAQDAFAALELG